MTLAAADGMAGFLDLTIGALIAYLMAKCYGQTAPWWHLLIGALLGLLPDLDTFRMMFNQGVQTARGDHRLTIMHRPLIMLPACMLLAYLVGGGYWAIIAGLCLAWHYAHDSAWLGSVSDIDWFWPITHRPLPYIDHPVWRETFWLVPSKLAIIEIGLGIFILGFLVIFYTSPFVGIGVAVLLWIGAGGVWAIHRCTA